VSKRSNAARAERVPGSLLFFEESLLDGSGIPGEASSTGVNLEQCLP
jgi:hypothetical protein